MASPPPGHHHPAGGPGDGGSSFNLNADLRLGLPAVLLLLILGPGVVFDLLRLLWSAEGVVLLGGVLALGGLFSSRGWSVAPLAQAALGLLGGGSFSLWSGSGSGFSFGVGGFPGLFGPGLHFHPGSVFGGFPGGFGSLGGFGGFGMPSLGFNPLSGFGGSMHSRFGWGGDAYDSDEDGRWTPAAGPEAGAPGARQGRRGSGSGSPGRRLDAIIQTIQKLPTELHVPREELERRSAGELVRLAKERRLEVPAGPLEKRELVERLADEGGSTATKCCICFSPYEEGDALRVLKCGHKFHLECVDQWALSAARDFSRTTACPMCNDPLIPD